MDFKNIPKKYRPIPFWSWNEKLEEAETAEQIHIMNEAGIGGFFMHARGGLQTEYMGEEWFDNVRVGIDTAKECGMSAWAYDENGWPSGFASGAVNALGVEYQQKYLRMSKTEPMENIIGKSGEHWFYYDINPFYVDVLDKKVIKKFIELTYEPYYERFGDSFEGFFTDEPQISRDGIPWSFVFEKEYRERFGENILERLEELFLPIDDFKATRQKFWKMVTDLFSESYMKQIHDSCAEHGVKFTGHLLSEETLNSQLLSNGACMPQYEYFDMPGMDWLGRDVVDCLTARQVSSVAEQLGKDDVLSETFALCGHAVSFAELKGIYEWQMVRGINRLCPHLEGYSLRGLRKRDYPPAMYKQQPWWSEYDKFTESMSRIGMLLSKGKVHTDVLLLHPQTTAWTLYDYGKNVGIKELNDRFISIVKELEQKHILFHLGDETIMERHARVENGRLIIGTQSYGTVISECCEILFDNTKRLLDEFVSQGGKIVTADDVKENAVTDNPDITYTLRKFDGFNIHYFVNSSYDPKSARITVEGKVLDILTGELEDFDGEHEFEPWGSLLIIEDGSKNVPKAPKADVVTLDGDFDVIRAENAMTLDRCDYYFDGELQERNGYVLNIANRANDLMRKVKIHQDYHVMADYVPEQLYLVCETPERFDIKINGNPVTHESCGYFRDKSFKKLDISGMFIQGENVISFDCDFVQPQEVYDNLEKSKIFETEKNKLSYDMEIEAIYLLGDFGVKTEGSWESCGQNSPMGGLGMRYSGCFVMSEPKRSVRLKHIEQQGFPFFCGEMELCGKVKIEGDNPVLVIDKRGINAVKVEIDGITKTMLWSDRLPLSDFNVRGETEIKLTLINSLRNLLGPHHLEVGESGCVAPSSFFKENCLWKTDFGDGDWNDDYCFVETGI